MNKIHSMAIKVVTLLMYLVVIGVAMLLVGLVWYGVINLYSLIF